jgi:hypothetical protein
VIGISLKLSEQLKPDVVWDVLGKVIQSNDRFGLTARFELHLGHMRMPALYGRAKTKVYSRDLLSAIKKIIVVVKVAFLCLAHALIIAITLVYGDYCTNHREEEIKWIYPLMKS